MINCAFEDKIKPWNLAFVVINYDRCFNIINECWYLNDATRKCNKLTVICSEFFVNNQIEFIFIWRNWLLWVFTNSNINIFIEIDFARTIWCNREPIIINFLIFVICCVWNWFVINLEAIVCFCTTWCECPNSDVYCLNRLPTINKHVRTLKNAICRCLFSDCHIIWNLVSWNNRFANSNTCNFKMQIFVFNRNKLSIFFTNNNKTSCISLSICCWEQFFKQFFVWCLLSIKFFHQINWNLIFWTKIQIFISILNIIFFIIFNVWIENLNLLICSNFYSINKFKSLFKLCTAFHFDINNLVFSNRICWNCEILRIIINIIICRSICINHTNECTATFKPVNKNLWF